MIIDLNNVLLKYIISVVLFDALFLIKLENKFILFASLV